MTTDSKTLLDVFLATFGEPLQVIDEIKAYWKTPGASAFPLDIYCHLMEARKEQGVISPEHAEFLTSVFAESFAPEPTTGYYYKHREPLVQAFVGMYAQEHPDTPLLRVEADIMNLGGLNRDLTSALPRFKKLGDTAIRLMSGVVRRHLEECGEVCAIRHLGDELTLFVVPRADVTIETVRNHLKNAEAEIAEFVLAANLRNIPHTKQDPMTNEKKPPGLGIGCSVIDVHGKRETAQRAELEQGVLEAKERFQCRLGPRAEPTDVPRVREHVVNSIEGIRKQLQLDKFRGYSKPFTSRQPNVALDDNYHGDTPEDARLGRMRRAMDMDSTVADFAAEDALRGTHALTAKVDHVADLPMFADMKNHLIPNFLARFGDGSRKMTLVHFDYNNIGGGNALGPWVGDAMSKVFAQCIEHGMDVQGMHGYYPYLTSQGGGKYALLLPAGTDQKAIDMLYIAIEKELYKRSEKELQLTPEQLIETRKKISGLEIFYKRNRDDNRSERRKPNIFKAQYITISDICNLKTRLDGANVTYSVTEIDDTTPLGESMGKMEKETNRAHTAINKFLERKERREHENSRPHKPTSTVDGENLRRIGILSGASDRLHVIKH